MESVSVWEFYDPSQGDTLTNWTPHGNRPAATGRNIYWPAYAGGYSLLDAITMAAAGQQFIGDGVEKSFFTVPMEFNMSASGVIIIPQSASENEAGVTDMGMKFFQPVTANRVQLIGYPWAIYAPGVSRCKFGGSFRISNGWNGILLSGNTGGFTAGSLQICCFSQPFFQDGAFDSTSIAELKLWPYGCATDDRYNIYRDGAAITTFGQVDGLGIVSLKTFQQRIRFIRNLPNAECFGTVDSLHLDGTYGRLEFEAGKLQVGTWYGTTGGADDFLIRQSGGALTLGPGWMLGSGGTNGTDLIQVLGGRFSYQGGGTVEQVPANAAVLEPDRGRGDLGRERHHLWRRSSPQQGLL